MRRERRGPEWGLDESEWACPGGDGFLVNFERMLGTKSVILL